MTDLSRMRISDADRHGGLPAGAGIWSLATLCAGAASLAGSAWSPWGALVGLITAALGAVLLLWPGKLPRGDRIAVLAGMVLGLSPARSS